MGAQRTTTVPQDLREHIAYAERMAKWLELRFFESSEACVAALRADGRDIWVTDLSQAAVCFTNARMRLPKRLAVVIGTESTGCSPTMLAAADKRIYLPLHGFADSLNLSVAAALLLQRLQDVDEKVAEYFEATTVTAAVDTAGLYPFQPL